MRAHHSGRLAMTLALVVAIGCRETPAGPNQPEDLSYPTESSSDENAGGAQVPFSKLQLFFEFNSSANDLGLQLLLDADGWYKVTGSGPGNPKLLEFFARGQLRDLGITEIALESAEPSPEEVLERFPAGMYRFTGRTVDGEKLVGNATLSHILPPAAVVSPSNGQTVSINQFVITWNAIGGLAKFQIIVADEATGRELVADLSPVATSFRVPPEVLRPGTQFNFEVIAVSTNGNKTITEGLVTTAN